MNKYFNIAYIMPILVIIIFLIGIFGCDKVGQPDIRKEYKESTKPDFFGWKWDFKW